MKLSPDSTCFSLLAVMLLSVISLQLRNQPLNQIYMSDLAPPLPTTVWSLFPSRNHGRSHNGQDSLARLGTQHLVISLTRSSSFPNMFACFPPVNSPQAFVLGPTFSTQCLALLIASFLRSQPIKSLTTSLLLPLTDKCPQSYSSQSILLPM